MNKRFLVPAVVAFSSASSPAGADLSFISNYEHLLGTSVELKLGASSRTAADRAQFAVLAEISHQSRILSSWDSKSEFSQWTQSHGQPVRVSRELFDVLGLFDHWRVRTHGALDPAAQAVISAWTSAAARQRVPTADELAAALSAVRRQHWHLNAADMTATHLSTTPLVLASFTKSYIIDRAVTAAMRVPGIHSVVLNVGGDIVVRGAISEPVDIADPNDDAENGMPISQIVVRDGAVATSGDYRRGVDIAGVHYSHIVDPRTGMPAGDVISSTVVAPSPGDAGALATAFSILTPAESQRLAAATPGVEYLLVEKDGTRIASPGWNRLEATAGPARSAIPTGVAPAYAQGPAAARGAAAQWDPTMELSINFEIPVLGGGALRPFIAIWIEDSDKFPVRTLALWYHEDRFLTEVKAWYRADRLRSMSENTSIVRSIGAATRPPGKYTLKWDGKDQAGNFVKPGKYTVSLESSREHGTYQIDRQEMTFSGAPQVVEFKPGTELGVASFDYHKIVK
jgi:thiamine biosynthesis lipoprotein ApbE